MNAQTIISETETRLTATSHAALAQARHQLAMLQGKWSTVSANLTANLNQTWNVVRGRLRVVLDVPSREDLDRLSARLDELIGKPGHAVAEGHGHNGAPHDTSATEGAETEAHATHGGHEKKSRRR